MKVILGRIARDRKKIIKYCISVGLLLILAATLQTEVFGKHKLFGAVPDLTLCTVFCLTCFVGTEAGAISGLVGGFLLDSLGGTSLPVSPLCYLLLAFLVGFLKKRFGGEEAPGCFLLLVPMLLYRAAVTSVLAVISVGIGNLPAALLHAVLPEFLATALTGAVVLLPVKWICKKLAGSKRQTYQEY